MTSTPAGFYLFEYLANNISGEMLLAWTGFACYVAAIILSRYRKAGLMMVLIIIGSVSMMGAIAAEYESRHQTRTLIGPPSLD